MGAAGEEGAGGGEGAAPPPLSHLGANWPGAGSPPPAALRPPRPPAQRRLRRTRRTRRTRAPHRLRRVGRGHGVTVVLVAIVAAGGLAVVQARTAEDRDDAAAPTTTTVIDGDVPSLFVAPAGPAAPVAEGYRVGGEVVDRSTFAGGAATGYTPATAVTAADWAVVGALYDGLTDVDPGDAAARPRPAVTEGWKHDGGSTWLFRVRPGLTFSDGSPVLASSFADAWDAAASPDNTAADAELFRLISGGEERRRGEATHIAGVSFDDDLRLFTVSLTAPFPDFPALVAHPIFSPVSATGAAGNGPFVLEGPPGGDGTVGLVRNPEWNGGDYDGELRLPARPFLDRLVLAAPGDTVTVGAEVTTLVTGRAGPSSGPGPATRREVLTSYYLAFDGDDPAVGGTGSAPLRQAIIQAVDRERIAREAFGPAWMAAASLTPPAMPGYEVGTCPYCVRPEDGLARRVYEEWLDTGGSLPAPLRIVSSDRPGEARAAEIVVENLSAAGIAAESVVMSADGFDEAVAEGTCQVCLRRAEPAVVTYEAVLGPALGSVAWGPPGVRWAVTTEAEAEMEDAREAADSDQRRAMYRIAETTALETAGVVPLVWGLADQAYDPAAFADVPVHATGAVAWERVALAG